MFQIIIVLIEIQIEDLGKFDFKEIFVVQSGIILGIGENGNVFGDWYVICGYEVCSDVFVDGLCDLGMIICESFVLEQVEVIKGFSFIFVG